jgi:hypothetical protein
MRSNRKNSNKKVLIKCKCQKKAIKRPDSLLRTVICRSCGKVFRSNKEQDFCFDCE